MRKRVTDALIEMGVPANLRGFQYIVETMEIYAKDESYVTSKKLALYSEIAKRHGVTVTSVERCMRHAFAKAVVYDNLNSLNKYMAAAQKPTNSNLLACLYLKVKEFKNEPMCGNTVGSTIN